LTAAVVAVYLGLVLAGATPQPVAQTSQPQSIQRRSENAGLPSDLAELAQPKTEPSAARIAADASSCPKSLGLSQTDAIFRLSLAFAAADLARTTATKRSIEIRQLPRKQASQLVISVHNAGLDAISSERFSNAVPLPRSDTAS